MRDWKWFVCCVVASTATSAMLAWLAISVRVPQSESGHDQEQIQLRLAQIEMSIRELREEVSTVKISPRHSSRGSIDEAFLGNWASDTQRDVGLIGLRLEANGEGVLVYKTPTTYITPGSFKMVGKTITFRWRDSGQTIPLEVIHFTEKELVVKSDLGLRVDDVPKEVCLKRQ